VRGSGPELFVDVHVTLDGEQSLDEAHSLTDEIEKAVQQLAPGIDVTIHAET
jgi:ferrous-iron efflux pump FieF